MKKTTIYLIRHSEQLKFKGDYFSKDDDQIKNEKTILSVIGEQKAFEISQIEELKKIDIIYTSNYVRAIATAKYIAYNNGLEINVDARFGERKLGDLGELEKLGLIYKESFSIEQLKNPHFKNKNGESNFEVRMRMKEAITEILNKNNGKKVAIVSHGAAIKFFLQEWCEYNYEKDEYLFNGKQVWQGYLEAPSCLKLVFTDENLKEISKVK